MHNFVFELGKLLMMKMAPIEVGRETLPIDTEIGENENVEFQNFFVQFRKIKDKESHCSL